MPRTKVRLWCSLKAPWPSQWPAMGDILIFCSSGLLSTDESSSKRVPPVPRPASLSVFDVFQALSRFRTIRDSFRTNVRFEGSLRRQARATNGYDEVRQDGLLERRDARTRLRIKATLAGVSLEGDSLQVRGGLVNWQGYISVSKALLRGKRRRDCEGWKHSEREGTAPKDTPALSTIHVALQHLLPYLDGPFRRRFDRTYLRRSVASRLCAHCC